jgi:hypothetical protein
MLKTLSFPLRLMASLASSTAQLISRTSVSSSHHWTGLGRGHMDMDTHRGAAAQDEFCREPDAEVFLRRE